MINALRYTEDLEKAGFTAAQAKSSVKIWLDLMEYNFATKHDLREHTFITSADLKDTRLSFEKRCDELDKRLISVLTS